jgi:hypothetical protein
LIFRVLSSLVIEGLAAIMEKIETTTRLCWSQDGLGSLSRTFNFLHKVVGLCDSQPVLSSEFPTPCYCE